MKLKSIFGAVIAVVATCFMAIGVQAATTFSAGVVDGTAGSNVAVPVYAQADSGTSDTINGYIMRLKYNASEATPVVSSTKDATGADCYATVGEGLADGILVADVTEADDGTGKSTLTVAWATAQPVSITDAQTQLASVEFAVADTAKDNIDVDVQITALTKDGQTMAGADTYSVSAGTINLAKGLLGDVNDDKVINGTDVLLLTQYVNGVITDLEVLYPGANYRSDVNSDIIINGTDVLLLAQYVNGVITSF